MSGYLEVKLCSKGNRGLTPWKAWKKQWCILRPSPLKEGGLYIVFHASAGLASNSQVEIPKHSMIYRTESKTKCHSFGVFPTADSRKPILLLAGQSESEAQLWIGRIRALLHGNYNKTDKISSHKNGFAVSLIDNTFTNSCGLKGVYGNLMITRYGFQILDSHNSTCRTLVKWEHVSDITLQDVEKQADRNKICVVTTNREFEFGHGQIHLFCHMGAALHKSLKNKTPCDSPEVVLRKMNRRISRSEGTLFRMPEEDLDRCLDENQRDSGLSSCGPISNDEDKSLRISMDDDGVVLKAKKASTLISAGMMLSSKRLHNKSSKTAQSLEHFDDILSPLHYFPKTASLNRRCSGASIASGIYEEILEQPSNTLKNPSILVSSPPRPHKKLDKQQQQHQDNTYEVLKGECSRYSPRSCFRRTPPPPLPPRTKNRGGRLDSTSDSGLDEESSCSTPHGSEDGKWTSLHGSLPRLSANKEFEVDKSITGKSAIKNTDKIQSAFGVFRKRIKSESQVSRSHQNYKTTNESDSTSYQGNENATRKRLFEFNLTPLRANQKVKDSKISRALKKLGVGNGNNSLKSTTKSCETLECKEEVDNNTCTSKMISSRCSKSEENLDYRVNAMNGVRDESYETKRSNLNLSTEWCSSDNSDENIKDLSVIQTEESIKHSYPKDILELLLTGKIEQLEMRLKQKSAEEEYMLMSPCQLNDNARGLEIQTCFEPDTQTVNVDKSRCPAVNIEDNYVVMKSA